MWISPWPPGAVLTSFYDRYCLYLASLAAVSENCRLVVFRVKDGSLEAHNKRHWKFKISSRPEPALEPSWWKGGQETLNCSSVWGRVCCCGLVICPVVKILDGRVWYHILVSTEHPPPATEFKTDWSWLAKWGKHICGNIRLNSLTGRTVGDEWQLQKQLNNGGENFPRKKPQCCHSSPDRCDTSPYARRAELPPQRV